MVRKRERENPCYVCGHYHNFEEGEVCGVCGHRLQDAAEKSPLDMPSAFATEILPSFLYLGTYDNASRAELLKAQGITRVLNTVPTCPNLYKNSFTYKTIREDQMLPFDECSEFIEQSRMESARVLVHCMTGLNRSPAVVIAYLMRYKGWRLAESYQWVKDRRPAINLSSAIGEQLQLYEAKIFGPKVSHTPVVPSESSLGFHFGFTPSTPGTSSMFCNSSSTSSSSSLLLLSQGNELANPSNFIFGASREQDIGVGNINGTEGAMDSSS